MAAYSSSNDRRSSVDCGASLVANTDSFQCAFTMNVNGA